MTRRHILLGAAVLVAVAAGGWSRHQGIPAVPDRPDTGNPPAAAQQQDRIGGDDHPGGLRPQISAGQARRLLQQLSAVDGTVTVTYDRDSFGEPWSDVDDNGCNQRDDTLLRDAAADTITVAVQDSCDHDVLAGTWHDPYTGQQLTFDDLKDPSQAQALTIDHVVPLAEAHRSGAASWGQDRRTAFANDLTNLVAVGGAANSSKSDQDPATWQPPPTVRCDYATVWVSVKTDWGLGVDRAERAALQQILASC